jgi:hypothetical protein
LFFFLLFLTPLSSSQQIPRTDFTTLTGARVVVPQEAGTKPLLLLLTFSHKGADDVAAWNKRFKVSYEIDQRIDYYELSDFQGVPAFVMKMILHGMRRSVVEPERSHSAPFYSQEAEWKKLVNYDNPKVTYLVLADAGGHAVWQTHGPATSEKTAELESAIAKLRPGATATARTHSTKP